MTSEPGRSEIGIAIAVSYKRVPRIVRSHGHCTGACNRDSSLPLSGRVGFGWKEPNICFTNSVFEEFE